MSRNVFAHGIFLLLLLVAAVSRLAASPPPGGDVRGKISIVKPENSADDARRFMMLNRYGLGKSAQADVRVLRQESNNYSLPEKTVIFLENTTVNAATYPAPQKHAVLHQRNLMFRPQVLPVLVGATVDFPNDDDLFHNVFSFSRPKDFDLGRYPRGDSRAVTFDEAGIVRVYCDIHAHMNATILVLSNPYFAIPDDEGNYSIPNVPDGKYTLSIWYGRDVVDKKTITVRNGETTFVDLNL